MPISIMSGNRYATKQLVNGNVKVQGFDVAFPDWGTVAPLFNSFYHNLIRSGRARAAYLQRCLDEGALDDHFRAS